jgi:PAS domain S-box-containing protein
VGDENKDSKPISDAMEELRRRIADSEISLPPLQADGGDENPDPAFPDLDESEHWPMLLGTKNELDPAEEPESQYKDDVTSSGSFDLAGIRSAPFSRLLQALPIPALLVAPSFEISFANRATSKISQEDTALRGTPFLSLFPEGSSMASALSSLENVLSSRLPQVFESAIDSEDRKVWARVHLRSLRMGEQRSILVLVEDMTDERERLVLIQRHQRELLKISNELDRRNKLLEKEMAERKKAEAAIERAKKEWERTLDTVKDMIAIIDNDGRIARLNKAMADMLGLDVREAIGKRLSDRFLGIPGPEELRSLPDGSSARDPHETEVLSDSLTQVFDVCSTELQDETGQLVGWVQVARDITDRKRTEKLVLESGRAKAVSELAGVVAHSINNLLQIVIGGGQLALTNLELGNLGGIEESIDQILRSAQLGATTVQRLNYLARAQPETGVEEGRVLDLSRVVHQALDVTSPWWKTQPEKSGIKIVVNRNLGPNCFVRGNDTELFEVVVNLVKNAAEALPEGGIISVRTFADHGRVVLEVQDSGIGIPQQDLDKIFEPFWTSKGVHASGVGLERTRGVVQRHGGEITVESQEGKGTTFMVKLPRTEPPAGLPIPVAAEELGPELHILVVDDMEPVVRMLRDGLKKLGHTVFSALSGVKAVEIFRTHEIDAVICDLGMPEMNGWQVAKAVREICEEKGIAKTPFVLLTGWGGQTNNLEKAAECGVDRVVEKPMDIPHLMKVVRELTAETRTAGRAS